MTLKFSKRCYIALQIRSPGWLDIKIQEQAVFTCWKTSLHRRRLSWLNRNVCLELRIKRTFEEGQENQKDYKDAVGLFRMKIREVKAQIEFNLATAIKDKKIFVSFFSAVKRGLRRIPRPLLDVGGKQSDEVWERLEYFIPPFPLSLVLRWVFLQVPSILNWKVGMGNRLKAPQSEGKWSALNACTSLWDHIESTQEYWGSW